MLLAANIVTRYLNFYADYAMQKWDNITPMQYGYLLIGVGIFGWVLMKSIRR